MTTRLFLPWLALALAAAPADRLPRPRPEPCRTFVPDDPAEGEVQVAQGLGYEQVTAALDAVIQTALWCPRPEGRSELGLTFELLVGCDGVVRSVTCQEPDGAPEAYVACVAAVIQRADFPAHDLPDGQQVTYPVSVAW